MNIPAHMRATIRGFSLIEALIAMVILATGLISIAKFQSTLVTTSDFSKQRTEAIRLGEQKIEQLRAFELLPTTGSKFAYSDIVTGTDSVTATNTAYSRVATVTDAPSATLAQYKTVSVNVSWTDRQNTAQSVKLTSVISMLDPKVSGSLIVPPAGSPVKKPKNRDLNIPVPATDLGNGRSGFTPPGAAGFYYVFNNTTGTVTAKCLGLVATYSLLNCPDSITGYIISGYVNFDTSKSPSAQTPASNPVTLTMSTVRTTNVGGTPADECYNDSPPALATYPGQTVYTCLVYPFDDDNNTATKRTWSGTLKLAFPLGSYKVCRYSYDYNGDGSINNNEHPATYTAITQSLENQNFLVIDATQTCPSDTTVPSSSKVNYNTIQTQP